MENTERTQEKNLCEFIFKTDDKKQEASLFGIVLSEKDRNMRPESALAKCHIYGAPQRNSPETIVIPSHDPKTGYPVTALEDTAFSGMYEMKHLFIPHTVTRIEWNYSELQSLEKITVDNRNPVYRDIDGVLFSKNMTKLIAYPNAREGIEYSVPFGVQKLRKFSFKSNGKSIEYLNLPKTVIEIGNNAFYGCNKLRCINLNERTSPIKVADKFPFRSCVFLYKGEKYSSVGLLSSHRGLIQYEDTDCR